MLPVRKKILYTLCALALGLSLIELGGRVCSALMSRNWNDLRYGCELQQKFTSYATHGVRVYPGTLDEYYRLTPGTYSEAVAYGTGDTPAHLTYHINRQGFRGEDFPDKRPGTVRILALGSSSTQGLESPDQATYPQQLENFLNHQLRSTPPIEVLNMGMVGYTLRHLYNLLRFEGVAYHPDMVLINLIHNNVGVRDIPLLVHSRFSLAQHRLLRWLYNHSIVAYRTMNLAYFSRYGGNKRDPESLLKYINTYYVEYLEKILTVCREQHIQPVFIAEVRNHRLLPQYQQYLASSDAILIQALFAEDIPTSYDRAWHFSDYSFYNHMLLHKRLAETATRHHVPFIDPAPRFAAAMQQYGTVADWMIDWVHLTPAGNAILAEEIGAQLLPKLHTYRQRRPEPNL